MASDVPNTQIVQSVSMTGTPRSLRATLTTVANVISCSIDTILGIGMIASVLLNFANVLGRYVFGIALVGADEILIYGMVATIFLGGVSVTWRDAHLRLDVIVEAMPIAIRAAAKRVADLAIMVLCATVAYSAVLMAIEMARFDQRSLAAGLPMVMPHGAVALGMALMATMAGLRACGIRPRTQAEDCGGAT